MIYFIVLLIFSFGCIVYGGKENPKAGRLFYIFECLILILLASLRSDSMGGDAISYADNFPDLLAFEDLNIKALLIGGRSQPLWLVFNGLVKSILDSYLFYKIIHALIVNATIFFFAYKFPKHKFYFVLLFFISKFWYFEFEIQREVLAVCVFLFGYKYMLKKEYLKYFFISTIAFLFHVSALILFVFPLLLFFTEYLSYKKYSTLILFIFIVILFFVSDMFISINSIIYKYNDSIAIQSEYYSNLESNINSLIKGLIDVLLILLLIIVRKFEFKEYRFLDYFLIIMLIISTIAIKIPGFYRFNNYLYLFYLLALIDISIVKFKYKRSYLGLFVLYSYFIMDIIYNYSVPALFLGPDKKLISAFYPYISIF